MLLLQQLRAASDRVPRRRYHTLCAADVEDFVRQQVCHPVSRQHAKPPLYFAFHPPFPPPNPAAPSPHCPASISTPIFPFRTTFADSTVLQAQAAHYLAQVPFQHIPCDANVRAHARACSGCSMATTTQRLLMMQRSSSTLKSGHRARVCACLIFDV
jgi:hypothetical protein